MFDVDDHHLSDQSNVLSVEDKISTVLVSSKDLRRHHSLTLPLENDAEMIIRSEWFDPTARSKGPPKKKAPSNASPKRTQTSKRGVKRSTTVDGRFTISGHSLFFDGVDAIAMVAVYGRDSEGNFSLLHGSTEVSKSSSDPSFETVVVAKIEPDQKDLRFVVFHVDDQDPNSTKWHEQCVGAKNQSIDELSNNPDGLRVSLARQGQPAGFLTVRSKWKRVNGRRY